jgi:hypothetical protein
MFLAGGQNQCDNCDLSVLWKGTMMCDCQIDQNGTVVVNGELEDDNVNKTDLKRAPRLNWVGILFPFY